MHCQIDPRLGRSLMEQRTAHLRGAPIRSGERRNRRVLRRWIGHRLVALGSRLVNDPAMRPARAR